MFVELWASAIYLLLFYLYLHVIGFSICSCLFLHLYFRFAQMFIIYIIVLDYLSIIHDVKLLYAVWYMSMRIHKSYTDLITIAFYLISKNTYCCYSFMMTRGKTVHYLINAFLNLENVTYSRLILWKISVIWDRM